VREARSVGALIRPHGGHLLPADWEKEESRLCTGVGGEAVGGFGDADGVDLGGGDFGVELACELVGDVFGEILCCGVERVEWGAVVEVVVGEGLADVFECVFEEVEVAEESFGVELIADNCCGGLEVVAVDWFGCGVEDDGVGGAELVGDLDGEVWWHYGS